MSTAAPSDSDRARASEAGIALLASVLLLLMLASIGLASLNVVERDQQVAGYLNRKAIALHAADAGIAHALGELARTGTPAVSATAIGDATLYPHGQPSYRTDTTAANPIEKAGPPVVTGEGCNLADEESQCPPVQHWKIRVQGEAPGGSIARVEAVARSIATN